MERSARVREMFDRLNRVMTFGLDRLWCRRVVCAAELPEEAGLKSVSYERLMLGTMTLHRGERPKGSSYDRE